MDDSVINNTNFIDFINGKFDKYTILNTIKKFDTPGVSTKLNSYQKLLSDFVNDENSIRGILVYHGLGSGKTLTSISVAENMERKVIVLLPASLKKNFIKDLKLHVDKYRDDDSSDDLIKKKYTFISSNAWNSSSTIENIDIENKIDKIFGDEIKRSVLFKKKNPLDGKLLIIDEVHNLLVNIINPKSKNGIKIYNLIMEAKDLKIIALSGSPIVKHPYESAILFNMLRGFIKEKADPKSNVSKEKYYLFPSDVQFFNEKFIDRKANDIKNKHIYQERIVGLVSYYSGVSPDRTREIFPQKNKIKLVMVKMSKHQWDQYVFYRKSEIDKERISKHKTGDIEKSPFKLVKKGAAGSYRVNTRQISNFALPKGVKRPKWNKNLKMEQIYDDLINSLSKKHLTTDLKILSNKMFIMYNTIKKNKNKLILVYSDFKTIGGVGIFAKILEMHGWNNFNESLKTRKKTFALYTGDTDDKTRLQILKTVNNKENKYGKDIRVLLVTGAGAEGISLHNFRIVMQMEPFFNLTRAGSENSQITARAVRMYSHVNLPFEERAVDSYLYISVPPTGKQSINQKVFGKDERYTTDLSIYLNAKRKQVLIDKFLKTIREISIDCSTNLAHNKEYIDKCRTCIPNNKVMYYPDIKKHLITGNSNCIEKKVKSMSDFIDVTINGKEYKLNKKSGKVYKLHVEGDIKQLIFNPEATKKYAELN